MSRIRCGGYGDQIQEHGISPHPSPLSISRLMREIGEREEEGWRSDMKTTGGEVTAITC